MKLIKRLFNLSKTQGILALENSRDKRVLLIRSSDVLTSLNRVIQLAKSRNKRWRLLYKDYRKLEIKLVDTSSTRMAFEYWADIYSKLGYTFYSSYKAVQYVICTDVDPDYRVVVKLRSKAKYEVILGLFDTIKDAESFINYAYPTKDVKHIAYALNERSREYFRTQI